MHPARPCHNAHSPAPRTAPRKVPASAWAHALRGFAGDRRGNISILSIFLFLCLLIVGGVGIDVMYGEARRVKLQNTLDRAVLAAADLDQTLAPQTVVAEYFQASGLGEAPVAVEVQTGDTWRTVAAGSEHEARTLLVRMLGRESMRVPAAGTAEDRVLNTEIALVLDISGSMAANDKMPNLRTAAQSFVDTVLDARGRDHVSLSLVPYTADVNAGPAIYDRLRTVDYHDYSHCIRFPDAAFAGPALDLGQTYHQGQHFEASYRSASPITLPGCPVQPFERITAHSQDAAALNAQIGQLRPRANTSIHIGAKWGAALLDPSFQPVIGGLADAGLVDAAFRARPAAYDDEETAKHLVLMTDGQNVDTYRIRDAHYPPLGVLSPTGESNALWDRVALFRYLRDQLPVGASAADYVTYRYRATRADALLSQLCGAARERGIIIWTVGFEVGARGAQVMQDCASSPAHYFAVEGLEIADAFAAIARQINKLRLVE